MSQSEFETLKANLLSRKKLWEDDDFPAAPASLAVSERRSPHVVWMRPWVSSLNLGALSTAIKRLK